jgi:4-hydroxy-tetrahydrodipicolinate synthase
MARLAAERGADAVLVHPPVAFRGRADQDRLVLQYHAAIAEAGLPLILFYLYEAAGGISYGPQLLAELLARPEVLGIKVATLDSIMTYQQIARLVRTQAPEKLLITGEDRFLGYSLMAGASAALIGMGAACTALQSAFLQAYWSGDASQFLALNGPVDDLALHTFLAPMEGYILRMLWCLVHAGIIPAEAAFDPWGPPLGRAEFDEIGACLARLPRPGE